MYLMSKIDNSRNIHSEELFDIEKPSNGNRAKHGDGNHDPLLNANKPQWNGNDHRKDRDFGMPRRELAENGTEDGRRRVVYECFFD